MMDSELEVGRVRSVIVKPLGSALRADYTAASTTLEVEDTDDFDEEGGTLEVLGETATYEPVDETMDDDLEITLSAALTGSPLEGDFAYLYPRASNRWAEVVMDDEDTDTVLARIPKSLNAQLPEGTRDDGAEELVQIRYDDDDLEWVVVDLPQVQPQVDFLAIPFLGGKYPCLAGLDTSSSSPLAFDMDAPIFTTLPVFTALEYEYWVRSGMEGYYRIEFHIEVDSGSASDRFQADLYKVFDDGSPDELLDRHTLQGNGGTTPHQHMKCNSMVYLGTGDSIRADLDWSGGAAKTIYEDRTWVSVQYLGNNGVSPL